MRLHQIAQVAGAALDGDGEVEISRVADVADAGSDALVVAADQAHLEAALAGPAGALLVRADAPPLDRPALRSADVRLALAKILTLFAPPPPPPGVHPTAVVAASAALGRGVHVGPHAVVGERCRIGDGAVVEAGCVLGDDVVIGARTRLYPRVVVYPRCEIGRGAILHSGVVIGADGFGFAHEEARHVKIPHLGRVVVEDDVEIGANSTVDRATLGETRVGAGTKIDDLVLVAHNVRVGPGTLIAGQSGIAGSSRVGAGVVMAGQTGVKDHVEVGDGAILLARAAVFGTIRPGEVVSGAPAQPHDEEQRERASLRRLPALVKRVRALEEHLARLLERAGRAHE